MAIRVRRGGIVCLCAALLAMSSAPAFASQLDRESESSTPEVKSEKPKSGKPKVVKTEVKGTVANVGVDFVAVKTAAAEPAAFKIETNTRIERNGKKAMLADISVGDRVEVTLAAGVVVEVEARGK